MPPAKNLTWSAAHQQRYNAIFTYLKNGLQLDINKDDYMNTLTPRLLFKYIMDNPKWAMSTKENYLFAVARKLNILKKPKQASLLGLRLPSSGRKSNKRARTCAAGRNSPTLGFAGYSTRCAPSTWSLAARMYGKISTFPKEVDDVAEWLQAIGLVRILLPCRAQCYGKSHALSLSLSLALSLSPSSHSPNTNRPSLTPWWSRHSCASSPTRNSESL